MSFLDRALRMGEAKKFKTYEQRVGRINGYEPELEHYTDGELRESADELRQRARAGESLDELMFECFALVREAGKRSMGMRHFDVQLIGGMVLHDGAIAEMKTGEGKTLTATLAVVLNSLAGRGVHLITVNDYLARRDAEWMKPIYDVLGVTVGILQNMQPYEEKQAAYAADVTYGTNSEFGFDYLRDNMATTLEEKVQHGGREKPADWVDVDANGKRHSFAHQYAIVDEVDNILIDEARTPLIISGAPEQAADLYARFARLAPQMEAGTTPLGMDPRAKKEFVADFDFEFDEKHKTVAISERGVAKAEKFLGIDHLYKAENGHLVNHLQQALKAESLYKRGVDYEVIDDEVKIIDEFTGRILEGRRWSEGLHQAVEAKEGVAVQEESQTLATITLQNYFRMYEKLAGMTGTALTEASEFMKIYELPVVEIPTNEPMVRDDRNDQIYKTKDGKWAAVLSCGTERHESRRIDNQLRGRSGRQGDPGESRFFLSAEDDLVRLFAGERIYKILDRFGTTDEEGNEEPIEAKMLTSQIEKAQKKVEEQNFLIRKRVLEYDDVMNQQREVIYEYRDRVLEGDDLSDEAREHVREVVERLVNEYTPGDFVEDWDINGLFAQVEQLFPTEIDPSSLTPEQIERAELVDMLAEDALALYAEREEELGEELMRALERYLLLQIIDERWREHLYDMDYLREGIHLRGFAQIEPILAYTHDAFELFNDLMHGIWTDFARMIFNVEVELTGPNGAAGAPGPSPVPSAPGAGSSSTATGRVSYSGGAQVGGAEAIAMASAEAGAAAAAYQGDGAADEEMSMLPQPVEQRHVDEHEQIGRNDPCWCGSGKKYKKCHGA